LREEEGSEGAHHVLGAVSKVDYSQHAEDFEHPLCQFLTSGQPPSDNGRNASSAGIVARSL
jgi:hypothetical protein